MRRIYAVLFIALFALLAVSVVSRYDLFKKSDFVIVPGERIGPVVLGMDFKAAKRILGRFGETTEDNGWYFNSEKGVGFSITAREYGSDEVNRETVGVVITDDRRFRTEDGIGPGVPASESQILFQKYGAPTMTAPIAPGVIYVEWKHAGIALAIELAPNGGAVIYAVSVFPAQPSAPQGGGERGTF